MKNIKKLLLLLMSLGLFLILDLFVSDSINPYILQIIVYSGINIMLAVSLNLINGFTGQFSIGHAGFMAIGAYSSAAITFYLGPTILASPILPHLLLKWIFFIFALTLG